MTGTPAGLSTAGRRATACAVVRDDAGRVLLQRRRDDGAWELPGGAVEEGETVGAAVVREVEEETGCRAEVVRLTGVYSDPDRTTYTYPDGNVVAYVSVCLECRHLAGAPHPTAESSAAHWFTVEDALATISERHRERLLDALAGREAAAWT